MKIRDIALCIFLSLIYTKGYSHEWWEPAGTVQLVQIESMTAPNPNLIWLWPADVIVLYNAVSTGLVAEDTAAYMITAEAINNELINVRGLP
jgi:hypothetical protein